MKKVVQVIGSVNRGVNRLSRASYLGQTWAFVCAAVLIASVFGASAQGTNTYPDPSPLYTTTGSHFNNALLWVIGATAVLMVLRWIKRAMGR